MKQKRFYLFRLIPVTDSEIQSWISKVAPGISQLQRKEYTRQWNIIDKIWQEGNERGT
jgi:hypothetical protein